jgi:integrase
LAEFLRFVADDPLFALWWLVALRGLRRGEVAGLRWQDIDLDRR